MPLGTNTTDQTGLVYGITLIALLLVLIFFVIIPSVREKKRRKEMLANLAVGDFVAMEAGVRGTIVEMLEDAIVVEIGTAKTRLEIAKWGVANVLKKAK